MSKIDQLPDFSGDINAAYTIVRYNSKTYKYAASALAGSSGMPGLNGDVGPAGPTGPTGPAGATGAAGTNGTNGVGVPVGGTTGQVLAKTSATNYATGWVTLAYVTGVTATAPVTSTGGAAPVIAMAAATASVNGYMSSTYASKLDGIAASANNYTHPANHPPSIITQDASNRFVTDAEKTTWNGKQTYGYCGAVALGSIVQGVNTRGRSADRSGGNANTSDDSNPSGFNCGNTVTGMPDTGWYTWINVAGPYWSGADGYGYQLSCSFWDDRLRFRHLQSGAWYPWYDVLTGSGLTFTGNLTMSGNFTAYSDEKLKANWIAFDASFVKQLSKIKSGSYERIDDNNKRQVGVSAQDLQKLMPEAVLKDKDGILSVAYGNAALAACVELAKEIQLLKAEIALLKAGK